MAASYKTIDDVYAIISKHCTKDQLTEITTELLEVDGNPSFLESIKRLHKLHKQQEV